ncbi:MAG: hypothetical protein A2268_15705 [Candidatus Raymondbacteria bacterium RifOxyA12_full_50_37]|uniref:HTH araC/xylS-type domain-containing protein n=1 Tax=Candidatus Raymondbacteria bacterium RIFOXYD12_FULL_49_13 TaxID=1817890 RepID=A0A1F7F4D9_UNCRA|nr:MAG: hypothetical protein A2268_15705 [Candidatus Raymondbacteria bacterium RifOxyA12_full_50_37]OGJ87686.1 MAG: hypothetical protein A2248_07410 [Candidatus Raymondbacteria bacterium RIFOXYA2_FULL_49_16]OGJ96489.1 MAG: hypothetical protein A2453_00030 [Candidatus Raymondbacteria bacterium RIFOXYC2_FULL_50_21]OGK01529.1 MAG: hypothetical protein A2519_05890 [Candidatus Raymondbacteria bacterium RIFOXYD12_FULL_49_13]OGK06770.1 MAG: hypothetical protein A2487_03875 [Candidatus Raymondbacteria 
MWKGYFFAIRLKKKVFMGTFKIKRFSFLFAVFFTQTVFTSDFLSEDFESPQTLNTWDMRGDDSANVPVLVDRSFAFQGNGGLRISAGHYLSRNMRIPIDSGLFGHGFYCTWYFRLFYSDTICPNTDKVFTAMLRFIIVSASGENLSNPTVIISKKEDGNNHLQVLMRSRKGDQPLHVPTRFLCPLQQDTWYKARFFVRIRNDTLTDSMYINDSLFMTGSRALAVRLGIFHSWNLGLSNCSKTHIAAMDVDNISIVQASTIEGNEIPIEAPAMAFPPAFGYLNNMQPEFILLSGPAATALTPYVWIAVDSAGRTLAESLFTADQQLRFSRKFITGVSYTYRTGFADSSGNIRIRGNDKPFHIGMQQGFSSSMDPKVFRMSLEPSAEGSNEFHSGDTVKLQFHCNPSWKDWYIDLNLSAESYAGQRNDQFGAFDPGANITYSIDHSSGVYFKYPEGSNFWHSLAQTTDSALFPLQILLIEKVVVQREFGEMRIAFRMHKAMRKGLWTVNAYIVSDKQARMVSFSPLYITITESSHWRIAVYIGSAILVLCTALAVRAYIRHEQHSPGWTVIARQVEQFLKDHYGEQELDSQKIAATVRLSERRLSTIYQAIQGRSPVQHLREMRIEKARELLKTTRQTVSEIGYIVGFSDPVIFQRNFKNQTGLTPRQFREKQA